MLIPTLNRRGLVTAGLALGLMGTALRRVAALDAGDQDTVTRAEQFFDTIRSLKARFLQTDSNGGTATGTLYLRKPGRMRFEYDPPAPLLIVADGTWLVVYDKSINQVDRYPLGETPLGVLASDKVRLAKGMEITRVVRDASAFGIELRDPDHADMGTLTLVFTDNPLQFHQWQVIDAQKAKTVVALDDVTVGGTYPGELFVFNDPPGTAKLQHRR